MNIKYLDSIHCQADKEAIRVIRPALEYESTWWKPGPFGKKRVDGHGYFIDGRSGVFLAGLLPRVKKLYNGPIDLSDREILKPEGKPFLKGVEFRDYQFKAIEAIIEKQRGVVKAATGLGKSIISMGLMSCYPSANILFLCHSISILKQIMTDMQKFGMKANFIQGSNKTIKPGINVASIQTFSKIDKDKYMIFFDICCIDESHHVISRTSQYGKVLQSMLAPMKIGFTATLPEGKEKILSLEGLIGNVIHETTINEGINMGVFVPPKIKLIPVPTQKSILNLMRYQEIYQHAIVESTIRNGLICRETALIAKTNKTVLIMIKDIAHGENLLDIFYEKYPDLYEKVLFVQGSTDGDVKEKIRIALNDKKIKVVIATSTWREGVNIVSLDCVIYAMSGKSNIQVLQAIGRGTRSSKDKESVIIVDMVDCYRYLSSHFAERLTLYLRNGWIE